MGQSLWNEYERSRCTSNWLRWIRLFVDVFLHTVSICILDFFQVMFSPSPAANGGSTIWQAMAFNRISWYFNPPAKNGIKVPFLSSTDSSSPPLPPSRLCWFCPVYRPSLSLSPFWWSSPSSYTTAAVTAVTGARDQRRRRRTKMAAQVTVTAGRRGGASAVSRGWRWQLSRCAGEEQDAAVIITYRALTFTQVAFFQWRKKFLLLYLSKSTTETLYKYTGPGPLM